MMRLGVAVVLCAIALALTVMLAGLDGYIEGRAFGARFEAPAPAAAVAILALAAAVAGSTSLLKDLLNLPGAWRGRKGRTRRSKGEAALTRGLNAAAMGDPVPAARDARLAEKLLGKTVMPLLLSAQAASLRGDTAAEQSAFEVLRDDPSTIFVGLRGLYEAASRRGDRAAALAAAQAGYQARPDSKWAFDAMLAALLSGGDWQAARRLVESARAARSVDVARARRAESLLLAAQAYTDESRGDEAGARAAAAASADFDPALVAAALIAARLAGDDAVRKRKYLMSCWTVTGDPRLARSALSLEPLLTEAAPLLDKMADSAPSDEAAALARAYAALARGDPGNALQALYPLLSRAAHEEALVPAMRAALADERYDAASMLAARLATAMDERALEALDWPGLVRDALHGPDAPEGPAQRSAFPLAPDELNLLFADKEIASPQNTADALALDEEDRRAAELDRAESAAREIN